MACLVALALAQPPARAQVAGEDTLEITGPVRVTLAGLQKDWRNWRASFRQDDRDSAAKALRSLQVGAAEVGMSSIPELSVAAAALAARAARDGDFDKASRALGAAEGLDLGRPETAFAAAEIAGLRGEPLRELTERMRGYARLLASPLDRAIWLHDLALWVQVAFVLTGCALVGLLMAARGWGLVSRWRGRFAPSLSPLVGSTLALTLLFWPLLLPGAFVLLAGYWSILLWGQVRRSERVFLVAFWLLVAAIPVILNEQRRRAAVNLSPMIRTVEDVRQGRLAGTMFQDLATLRQTLPESGAVRHLIADLHRRLGQWDLARHYYLAVLGLEPRNPRALVDAGACYYYRGEFEEAIEYFRQAAAIDPDNAVAQFDMSLALSELYRFAESEAALARAQLLDPERVGRWIRDMPAAGIATASGGLDRVVEIKAQLLRSGALADQLMAWWEPWRDTLSFGLVLGGLGAALLVVRLGGGPDAPYSPAAAVGRHRPSLWREVLVPGLVELEEGRLLPAVAAVAFPAALMVLPWVSEQGYEAQGGLGAPTSVAIWRVAGAGLAVFLLVRWQLRRRA